MTTIKIFCDIFVLLNGPFPFDDKFGLLLYRFLAKICGIFNEKNCPNITIIKKKI